MSKFIKSQIKSVDTVDRIESIVVFDSGGDQPRKISKTLYNSEITNNITPEYRSLIMSLEQAGTNAPQISYILHNTLVEDIFDIGFTYVSAGKYTVTSTSGVFTTNKVYLNPSPSYQIQPNTGVYAYVNSENEFYLETAINGTLSNGVLAGFIEIRVYN